MKKPIYLDYMSTTPLDPRVLEAMQEYMSHEGCFGNPATQMHPYGFEAAQAVDSAREQVAEIIHADDPRAIIWTSGATESINLALQGAAQFYTRKGRHIITVSTEHKAVLRVCEFLERQDFEVTYLSPQQNGLINIKDIEKALREDTILVSIMQVNNEIGVIQPISEIGDLLSGRGILFHVDAAQSVGKVPVDVQAQKIDLLSLSGHKAYGPKGVGALYVRREPPRVRLQPLFYGGGHQGGLRPGTLAPHQIVGMAEAFTFAEREREEEQARIKVLRDQLWDSIKALGSVRLNGDWEQRVANNLNVSFEGVEGEALLLALEGIAVTTGSACTSAAVEPSHVLLALGVPRELAHSTIRFALGRFTTEAEIQETIALVQDAIPRLRR